MGNKSNTGKIIRDSEKGSASGKKYIQTKPKGSEKHVKSVVSTTNIGRTASTSYAKKPEDAKASRDATTGNFDTDEGGQRGGKNIGPLETPEVALEGSSPRRSHRSNFGR